MFVLYNLLATTDLFPPENPMIPLKSCLSRSSLLLFRQSNWSQLHWGTLSMVCPCQTNIILREKLPEKTKTLQQSCWSYCKMKVIWSLLPSWAIPRFQLPRGYWSLWLPFRAQESWKGGVPRSYYRIWKSLLQTSSGDWSTVDGSLSKRPIVIGDIVRRSSSESESLFFFQLWMVMFDICSGSRSLRSARFKDLLFSGSSSKDS